MQISRSSPAYQIYNNGIPSGTYPETLTVETNFIALHGTS